MQRDPRDKLATAHMVLYSLAHSKGIDKSDKFPLEIALKELDNYIAFLNRNKHLHFTVSKIIDLLLPGRRIIELHLANDSSIKEIIDSALTDFKKAVNMFGNILQQKSYSEENELH